MLFEDEAIKPESFLSHHVSSVLEDQVSVPLPSSISISVGTDTRADVEGVVDGDQHLLLELDIRVARGIALVRGGKAKVMLTNFTPQFTPERGCMEEVTAVLSYSAEPTTTVFDSLQRQPPILNRVFQSISKRS